jgi:UTP--glucose-1-phosphate uridylyltransferase
VKIKKAIFPVAGFGTRFLPVTKTQPKEMLPVLNKPVIHYLVEEAVASGIEEIIIVTGRGKRAIEDYFDHSFELEHNLVEKGKHELLNEVQAISNMAKFTYVRQPVPRGDGDAILQAYHLVKGEPVAIMFGDDLVFGKTPALKQLIDVYDSHNASVIGLTKVPDEKLNQYGVVSTSSKNGEVYELDGFVEKPNSKHEAPSNLAVVGKYVLHPSTMDRLFEMSQNFDYKNELRLANAFVDDLKDSQKLFGKNLEGERFDTGSVEGMLKATLQVAKIKGIKF